MYTRTIALVALAVLAGCRHTPAAPTTASSEPTRALQSAQVSVDAATTDTAVAAPSAENAVLLLAGPHARVESLCPAPLDCELTRRTMNAGGVLEIAELHERTNPEMATFAVRTARGWFGTALDPFIERGNHRSPHSPGQTTLVLALSDSTPNGVGFYWVDRGSSFLPGLGSLGSSNHLNVTAARCSVSNDSTGAVSCRHEGMVFQHVCSNGQCRDTGTRPAGLTLPE